MGCFWYTNYWTFGSQTPPPPTPSAKLCLRAGSGAPPCSSPGTPPYIGPHPMHTPVHRSRSSAQPSMPPSGSNRKGRGPGARGPERWGRRVEGGWAKAETVGDECRGRWWGRLGKGKGCPGVRRGRRSGCMCVRVCAGPFVLRTARVTGASPAASPPPPRDPSGVFVGSDSGCG